MRVNVLTPLLLFVLLNTTIDISSVLSNSNVIHVFKSVNNLLLVKMLKEKWHIILNISYM